MTWIRTYSGKRIDLIDPRPEDIDFADMAMALSRICRFNGHTPVFYSVLQHSMEVAGLFEKDDPAYKYALLHDCHEAITGDITTPIKIVLDTAYPVLSDLQRKLDSAIFRAAGLEDPMPSSVKRKVYEADAATLRREILDVIGSKPELYEIGDLQQFPSQARIRPASDSIKLRIDWLKALES